MSLEEKVRTLIYQDIKNKNCKNLIKLKEIHENEDKLQLPERVLLLYYLNEFDNHPIDYHKLTHYLYTIILKEIPKKFNNTPPITWGHRLLEIFLPACNPEDKKRVLKRAMEENWYKNTDFRLLCEGEKKENYHIMTYYLTQGLLKCKKKNCDGYYFITKNGKLRCPKCGLYYSSNPYNCPECKKNQNSSKLVFNEIKAESSDYQLKCEKKDCQYAYSFHFDKVRKPFRLEEKIICTVDRCKGNEFEKNGDIWKCKECEIEYNHSVEDVYWCFGKYCKNPHSPLNELRTPDKLCIQHFSTDKMVPKLASWLNRLFFILPKAYCNHCKNVLKPVIISNNGLSFYKVTKFKCATEGCPEKDKVIYLNECCNPFCYNAIDSREAKIKCSNGFYICDVCNSCCHDYLFRRHGSNKSGHLERNMMFCSNCGNRLMLSKYDNNSLYCPKCRTVLPIILEHRFYKNWDELKKNMSFKKENSYKAESFSKSNESS